MVVRRVLEAYCETCETVVGWADDLVLVEMEADEHEDDRGHDVTIREDAAYPQEDASELPTFVERHVDGGESR